MEKITTSYLMWIGSEHYKSISEWVDEAKEMGVSKRLPNEAMGRALMKPGVAIFVAHDEGEHIECTECVGEIECRECRKLDNAIANEQDFIDELAADDPRRAKKIENAERRIQEHNDAIAACADCFGTRKATGGTGGKVEWEDLTEWDYNRYQYMRNAGRLAEHIEAHGEFTTHMCKACGGFGRLPNGKVFGMFLPRDLELIGDDDTDVEEAEAKGFKVVDVKEVAKEKKRRCGKRKVGGVYAATIPTDEEGAKAIKKIAKELGVEVTVSGAFAEFLRHVPIPGHKRCRGLSRFELPEAVGEEVSLIGD